jgi:hypothetical protein
MKHKQNTKCQMQQIYYNVGVSHTYTEVHVKKIYYFQISLNIQQVIESLVDF